MARKPGGAPAPVAPGELIDTALRLLRVRMAGQVQVSTHIATRRNLLADGGQVMQVLLNLGANALDAMEAAGGALTMAADDGPDAASSSTWRTPGRESAEVRDRLRAPSSPRRARARGRVSGLHVVSEIIPGPRGASVRAPTGRRHAFRVECPRRPTPSTKEPTMAEQTRGLRSFSWTTRRPSIGRSARTSRREPYEILHAYDSAEAAAILGQRPEVAGVLCDHYMPGTRGLDLLMEIRHRFPKLTTMLLTAQADLQLVISAINHGHIHRFFTKPWNGEELCREIRALLLGEALPEQEALVARTEARLRRDMEPLRDENGAWVLTDPTAP